MIRIEKSNADQSETVFDLVEKLLDELRAQSAKPETIDRRRIERDWADAGDSFVAFIALDDNKPVGVITLVDCFAIYAGGNFGIINELYIEPEYRSRKVGRRLLEQVKEYGRTRGWKRIDVTAPPGPKWEPSVRFYEREGFVFTGPKLKFYLT